jgi:cell wall assembly regulator SMI1
MKKWISVFFSLLIGLFSLSAQDMVVKSMPEKSVANSSKSRQTIEKQWQEIVSLQGIKTHQSTYQPPMQSSEATQIEELLGEPLPSEFVQLYAFANGQNRQENGLFLNDEFLNTADIINTLKISRSLVKPEKPTIENPEKAQQLLQQIADFYRRGISQTPKTWFKAEFDCGVGAFSGIQLYSNPSTLPDQAELLTFDDYLPINETIQTLYQLEEKSYNWDILKFTVYSDGKFEAKREYYALADSSFMSSSPAEAIQIKYFHYKWLPIFGDGGGNFIGIDLDPGSKGKKGQIINFGHDEDQMQVLANNLGEFFDFIITELKKKKSALKNPKIHLHDLLKKIKSGQD